MHIRQDDRQSLFRCETGERILEGFGKFPALGMFVRGGRVVRDVDRPFCLTHRPVKGDGRASPAAPHLVVARVDANSEEP